MSAIIAFQINIEARGTAGYGLRAAGAGRIAEAPLALPALPTDPEALGEVLGKALFPPPVRQLLVDLGRGADEAEARLQIQLSVAPPELATLPWEWISLGGATPWRPAVREDYTLVRVSRTARSLAPRPVAGPLRLLVACAPGEAARAAGPLGHALVEPVQAGGLVVDLLRDADAVALRTALSEEPCHALHLVVADATGTGQAARLRLGRGLDAAGLVGLLGDAPDLRLLTIAADPDAEIEAIASVSAAIHERTGLATLALGGLDYAQTAMFCGPCYAALAAGDPTDLAVTDGRAALEAEGKTWGAPRLWTLPGVERLFTPAPAEPQSVNRYSLPSSEPELPPTPPLGTPLPKQATSSLRTTATKALATARSFVVDATAVGEPAQRRRPVEPGPGLLQPKLVVLLIASLILILLISRVLPNNQPDSAPKATPTQSLAMPTPFVTPAPIATP